MESAPRNLVHSRICQEIDQIMMALRTDFTNFEEDSRMYNVGIGREKEGECGTSCIGVESICLRLKGLCII